MRILICVLWHFFLCAQPAVAGIPTRDLQIPCESLLAEPPFDDMGREFATDFGAFARGHRAGTGQMMYLAEELFQIRLNLAGKYKTFFALQMTELTEGWPYWRARLKGLSKRRVFSFGIEDVPRADLVWTHFKRQFKRRSSRRLVETRDFPLYKGPAQVQAEVHDLTYTPVPGLVFKVFVLSTGQYYLEHAPDRMVPRILQRLEELWDGSLDKSRPVGERTALLTEWEWLWFWTNPFGRAGASVGATLSLLWEADLSVELGYPVWRTEFYYQDLEALSRSLEEYRAWRTGAR
jgi:hypothetical protein